MCVYLQSIPPGFKIDNCEIQYLQPVENNIMLSQQFFNQIPVKVQRTVGWVSTSLPYTRKVPLSLMNGGILGHTPASTLQGITKLTAINMYIYCGLKHELTSMPHSSKTYTAVYTVCLLWLALL